MADNVQDAPPEILKGIQTSIAQMRLDIDKRSEALTADISRQFHPFADEARKDRRKINGVMAIIQSVAGDFDERIRDIDDRVSVLEDRAS